MKPTLNGLQELLGSGYVVMVRAGGGTPECECLVYRAEEYHGSSAPTPIATCSGATWDDAVQAMFDQLARTP